MIGLLQRVSSARVMVAGEEVGAIGRGLLVLVGIEANDAQAQADRLLERLLGYRVFPDADGKMNLSLRDVGGGRVGAWSRDRRNAEQGPRLRGCDRGADHERVAADPMRVFGVRSPEGPLFRPTTRPACGDATAEARINPAIRADTRQPATGSHLPMGPAGTAPPSAGLLLVPQFTLAADTNKGMRASFSAAAPPELGRELFEYLVTQAHARYGNVACGRFGAEMSVTLTNEGPVTFWLES